MATTIFLTAACLALAGFSVAVLVFEGRARARACAAESRAAAAVADAAEHRDAYFRYRAGAHARRVSKGASS